MTAAAAVSWPVLRQEEELRVALNTVFVLGITLDIVAHPTNSFVNPLIVFSSKTIPLFAY